MVCKDQGWEALEAIAVGGRVVQVGMGRLEATINTRTLIIKAAELVGSVGGNTEDIKAVYALFASGELKPLITTISLAEIGEGLGRLARGEVKGRLVARL
jgi:propanol-preferring alcohol dehydrogenase